MTITPNPATATPTPTRIVASFQVNGRTAFLDQTNGLLAWPAPQDQAYQQIMQLSWDFLFNRVPPSTNGMPAYFFHSSLASDFTPRMDSPHNPASTFAMFAESALSYYAYSGDARVLKPGDPDDGLHAGARAHVVERQLGVRAELQREPRPDDVRRRALVMGQG